MNEAQKHAREAGERYRAELRDLLRIPSISTDEAYAVECRRAAEWLVRNMQAAGLNAELIETQRHPLVYAEWMGAGPDARTVLIYGHYDVQPASEDGWVTSPFEPVEKDGLLYARGSTDDKGQFFAHVKAVEAMLQADGKLPVNVRFIIEGEEESGGQSIARFVHEHPERLSADVCLVSDTSMQEMDQPVIVNALRGGLGFEITVYGPATDIHSGMFGGTVHNPAQALVEILAALHNPDGSVNVPGFYDQVRVLSTEERQQINAIEWTEAIWRRETGATIPWGEPDYTLRERVGARPTLEITGMAGGYFERGMKSIVPSKAWAKILCRLVPDQEPDQIAEALRARIEALTPPTVRVELNFTKGSPPVLVDTHTQAMQAAIRAYEKAWGAAPQFLREGGSIPIVAAFQEKLKLPVVLMGFGLNSDGLHGPNEHFTIEMFHRGIATSIQFLEEFAAL